ncbi:MFS transporter [Pseudanabaenaceae cyanobacterium LEGE 13415]|nr:MFS transporter [Pseudanabaenaceae cyanobacterium LEGE 13415]
MSNPFEVNSARWSDRSRLLFICLVVFLDFLATGILIPLIPPLVRQFNNQAFAVGLTFTAFAIGQFTVSPLLGDLSDRYGRRPILLISTLGGMIASLLLGVAPTIELVLVSRFLDGLTRGNLLVGQAYIADITPRQHRAKNFGLLGVALGLAFILGPGLGGGLSRISLQAPTIVAGGLYLVTALLVWFGLPESLSIVQRRKEPLQWVNLNPVMQIVKAFQRSSLKLLLIVTFLLNFAENGLRSNLQVLTAQRFELSIVQNAILFSYLGVISVLMQGIAIRPLLKRVAERKLIVVGLGLMVLGYSGVAIAPSIGLLYGALTFNSVGFGIASPTLLSRLSKGVSEQEQGFLMGAIQAIASLTLILSPAIAGLKFDRISTGAPYWMGAILLSIAALMLVRNSRFAKSNS